MLLLSIEKMHILVGGIAQTEVMVAGGTFLFVCASMGSAFCCVWNSPLFERCQVSLKLLPGLSEMYFMLRMDARWLNLQAKFAKVWSLEGVDDCRKGEELDLVKM